MPAMRMHNNQLRLYGASTHGVSKICSATWSCFRQ